MSTVYPTLPRLSVRDSFDEDDLSDVDDEVFIRDGKNGGLKLDEEGGVKRPLMAPRRKIKACRVDNSQKLPYRALLAPFCYGILALLVLLGLIIVCIYTVNLFPVPLNILRKWLDGDVRKPALNISKIVPCTSLASSVVWTRTLPKFTSESPFRSNDVNTDGVEDIIVGFSTGGQPELPLVILVALSLSFCCYCNYCFHFLFLFLPCRFNSEALFLFRCVARA